LGLSSVVMVIAGYCSFRLLMPPISTDLGIFVQRYNCLCSVGVLVVLVLNALPRLALLLVFWFVVSCCACLFCSEMLVG
jgi:ABC-type proline/glycine betaine transport system permease subunit